MGDPGRLTVHGEIIFFLIKKILYEVKWRLTAGLNITMTFQFMSMLPERLSHCTKFDSIELE